MERTSVWIQPAFGSVLDPTSCFVIDPASELLNLRDDGTNECLGMCLDPKPAFGSVLDPTSCFVFDPASELLNLRDDGTNECLGTCLDPTSFWIQRRYSIRSQVAPTYVHGARTPEHRTVLALLMTTGGSCAWETIPDVLMRPLDRSNDEVSHQGTPRYSADPRGCQCVFRCCSSFALSILCVTETSLPT